MELLWRREELNWVRIVEVKVSSVHEEEREQGEGGRPQLPAHDSDVFFCIGDSPLRPYCTVVVCSKFEGISLAQ